MSQDLTTTTEKPPDWSQIRRRGYYGKVDEKFKATYDPEHLEKFLAALATTGTVMRACEISAFSYGMITRFRKLYPEFNEMMIEAMECYKDTLVTEAHRRGVDGWDEPVFSHKTGEQMGVIKKYDSSLLQLLLKRHIPEFREKFEGTITHTGGVLIAPAPSMSVQEWERQFAAKPVLATVTDSDKVPTP